MNQAVRTEPGVDGQVVIMGAWCSRCRREEMPRDDDGSCCWCGIKIVDLDTLRVGRDGVVAA